MIRVLKGTIRADGIDYVPGDLIEGLSEEDEAILISDKIAELWGTQNSGAINVNESDDGFSDESTGVKSKSKKEVETSEDSGKEDKTSEPINIKFDAESYVDAETSTKPKVRK